MEPVECIEVVASKDPNHFHLVAIQWHPEAYCHDGDSVHKALLDFVIKAPAPSCKGTGEVFVDLPSCKGTGEMFADLPSCKGTGEVFVHLPSCKGTEDLFVDLPSCKGGRGGVCRLTFV